MDNLAVTIEKQGAKEHAQTTTPVRVGRYSEIRTPHYEFHFNLRGQIRFIRSLGLNWGHPSEMLKRTEGNDWVFYSLGSVGQRIKAWLGEYYLPCPAYRTNSVFEYNPFTDQNVMSALGAWAQLYANVHEAKPERLPMEVQAFFQKIKQNGESELHKQAQALAGIIGGRFSVLPPDARFVDYDVIPLNIADGCRYHCGFCCVKTRQAFKPRSLEQVQRQISLLKGHFGPDLANYRGVFLGNHDALGAGPDLILQSISLAARAWDMSAPTVFMFGSADSLLEAEKGLWQGLNKIAGRTYVNMGLESAHGPTLAQLKKPLSEGKVRLAFAKAMEINKHFENIQVSVNFLLGEELPPGHESALSDLLQSVDAARAGGGAVYISPLLESRNRRELLDRFFQVQSLSKIPAYIYLIQRL